MKSTDGSQGSSKAPNIAVLGLKKPLFHRILVCLTKRLLVKFTHNLPTLLAGRTHPKQSHSTSRSQSSKTRTRRPREKSDSSNPRPSAAEGEHPLMTFFTPSPRHICQWENIHFIDFQAIFLVFRSYRSM